MTSKKKKIFHDERCVNCNSMLRYEKGQIKLIQSESEAQEFSDLLEKPVAVSDALCGSCRSLAARKKSEKISSQTSTSSDDYEAGTSKQVRTKDCVEEVRESSQRIDSLSIEDATANPEPPQQLSSSEDSQTASQASANDPSYSIRIRKSSEIEMVEMPFQRVTSTHKYCCVCFAQPESLIVIPFQARLQVFIQTRIFIPYGNRCCAEHLIKKRFFIDDIQKLKIFSNTSSIDKRELTLFLNELSNACNNSILDRIEDSTLSDERIKSLTGYSIEQLSKLKSMLISMRNSDNRTINQALFVFLFKLRTGNSNNVTASIFDIQLEQNVSDYIDSVMKSFNKDILPNNFGVKACTREDLILNHTSFYVKKLHGYENRLVLIADGSYLRHQKSTNNCYQRKSYSGQKKYLCVSRSQQVLQMAT